MEHLNFHPQEIRYPVKHRRKVPFHPRIVVPGSFTERTIQVQRLDTTLDRYFLSSHDYLDLVNEAFSTNIHSSTALEGNPLDLDQVRRTSRKYLKGDHEETAVDGPYQEILNHLAVWLSPGKFAPPWNLAHIQAIHRALMDHDPKARPGRFRDHDELNIFSSKGQMLFTPCPHKYITKELASLLNWLNKTGPGLHPIVAATVLFHEFESIHPFEDGNGRTGRSLFHIYLQAHGLSNANRCHIEQEILKDPEHYYELLAWTDQEDDYQALIDHFSQGILTAYEQADRWHREKDLLSHDLKETTVQLLKNARRHKQEFTVRDAARWVQTKSDQTIRTHLNELVELGALETYGQTVSKRYRIANPLRSIQKKAAESTHPTA